MEMKAGKVILESVVRSDIGFTNNDPRVEASLVHFIKKYGQIKPVVVREIKKEFLNGFATLEAIEGRRIFSACCIAGLKKVFVINLGSVSDVEAEEINLSLNGIAFTTNYVKLSETVVRIYPGKTVDDLAHMLPFPTDEIKDFLELEKFHWDQFQPTNNNKSEDQFTMSEGLFDEE